MDFQPVWKPLLDLYLVCVSLCLSPQDTWMYPSVALFYPRLARAVLEYRVGTIEGARANAQQMGYKVHWGIIPELSAALYTLILFTVFPPVLSGTEVCMGECGDGPWRLSRGHLRRAGAAHQWRRGAGFPAVLLPHTGTDDTHIKTVHMCQEKHIRASSVSHPSHRTWRCSEQDGAVRWCGASLTTGFHG